MSKSNEDQWNQWKVGDKVLVANDVEATILAIANGRAWCDWKSGDCLYYLNTLKPAMVKPAVAPAEAMQSPVFKPGDVVMLKSGGPKMTISAVHGLAIDCRWFATSTSERSNCIQLDARTLLSLPNDCGGPPSPINMAPLFRDALRQFFQDEH